VSVKLHYMEVSLKTILNYWLKNYEPVEGTEITTSEISAIDVVNDKVVFKLYTKEVDHEGD